MAGATNRSRSVRLSAWPSASRLATTRSLAARTFLGGFDLLGAELRQLRIAHRRRLRDQLSTASALLPSLARSASISATRRSCSAMIRALPYVRDVEERALELARDPLQVLGLILHA
jgi:hypothetical protein